MLSQNTGTLCLDFDYVFKKSDKKLWVTIMLMVSSYFFQASFERSGSSWSLRQAGDAQRRISHQFQGNAFG